MLIVDGDEHCSTKLPELVPSTGEAEDAREGGERRRRSSGAPGVDWSSLCWSECPEEKQPAPEKEDCPAS